MSKQKKQPLTKAQKNARGRLALYIILTIILLLALVAGVFAVLNTESTNALMDLANKFHAVQYAEGTQLVPTKDADGDWCFVTDDDFRIVQITDVHIGSGIFSAKTDRWAMNAVANMITAEKPDLVIVTGDAAYPVPFSSGTFNNYNAANVFATMMEKLGVYWTFGFGNHDTEAYSYFSRDDIDKMYSEFAAKEGSHCLYQSAAGIFGKGNQIIKVKNSQNIVTQAITVFDSNSYTDGDVFGVMWKYDNIHQDQIDWYAAKMKKINEANHAIDPDAPQTKNLMFFHIALPEYREAWKELVYADVNKDVKDGNYNPTENVTYKYGVMGESEGMNPLANNGSTYGIFCGIHDDNVFETGVENGLQGVFIGHDHLNNFSIEYKGVRLTYGMSIDYLAYPGIWKQRAQRGCTLVTVHTDGSFDCCNSSYYQDKYKPNDESIA